MGVLEGGGSVVSSRISSSCAPDVVDAWTGVPLTEPKPTLRLITKQEPVQPGDLRGATLISRLEFVRLIGSGGMGEVWEVSNSDLPGQRFAVKVVALEQA